LEADLLCSGLNWLAKESVIDTRRPSAMEMADMYWDKNDAIFAVYS